MTGMWRNRIIEQRMVDASELQPHPLNPRRHPETQKRAVAGLLGEVGIVDSLTVYESEAYGGLVVLDGHLRKEMGGQWPVNVLDVTDEEAELILATFDFSTSLAELDGAALANLLGRVEMTPVEDDAVRDLLAQLATHAEQPKREVDAEPRVDRAAELMQVWQTATGQMWLLGEHRLICGDCTDAAVVARVMDGERAALMSTDPPYGVDFEGAKYNPRAKAWDGIEGDKVQGADLKVWLEGCLRTWFPHVQDDAAFYLWTAAMEEGAAAAAAIRASGLHIQSQIIWNKNTLVLGQADYQWKHENCWYAFWKGKHHRWFGGRAQTTVWDVSKIANSAYMHPMQKPVGLYQIAIENHTRPGEICAEPFSGSGTQIIACEQLGRKCRAVEISPAYVAVALQRYLDATGIEPRLLEAV